MSAARSVAVALVLLASSSLVACSGEPDEPGSTSPDVAAATADPPAGSGLEATGASRTRPVASARRDLPDPAASGNLDAEEEWGLFLARYRDAGTMLLTTWVSSTDGDVGEGPAYLRETWIDVDAPAAEVRTSVLRHGSLSDILATRWVEGSVYVGTLVSDDDVGHGWTDLTGQRPDVLAGQGRWVATDTGQDALDRLLGGAEPGAASGEVGRRIFEVEARVRDVVDVLDVEGALAPGALGTAVTGTQPLVVRVDATGRSARIVSPDRLPAVGVPEIDEFLAGALWAIDLELDPPLTRTVRVPTDARVPGD